MAFFTWIVAFIMVVVGIGQNPDLSTGDIMTTILGELVCPFLGSPISDICSGIVSFIIETANGTIEIRNINGEWVTLTSIPERFDLLQFPGEFQMMISKDVPPGRYDKLRIDLEKVEIVTNDKQYNAIMPTKELIFDIDMVVERNKKSVVELKIDLANSLHLTEDDEIIFTPVVDVKSKKNAQIQVIDQAKKLVKTLGATTVENAKVGMDLDGSMKKDFKLDKNKQLTIKNNKVVVKTQPIENQPIIETSIPSPQNPATPLETNTNSNVLPSTDNTNNEDYVPSVVEEESAPGDNTFIDDAIFGNNNAPITIVEWGDYECPFCGRFFSQTLPLIKTNYIDTGKVKLVYMDFPLSFHPNAQKAAEAAECAGDQGKYWQMHDKLFGYGVQGGISTFKQYAQQLGLNTASFNSCLDNGEKSSEVLDDFQDGQLAGVQGTPAFYVNGVEVSGAQPFSVFQQIIDEQLETLSASELEEDD